MRPVEGTPCPGVPGAGGLGPRDGEAWATCTASSSRGKALTLGHVQAKREKPQGSAEGRGPRAGDTKEAHGPVPAPGRVGRQREGSSGDALGPATRERGHRGGQGAWARSVGTEVGTERGHGAHLPGPQCQVSWLVSLGSGWAAEPSVCPQERRRLRETPSPSRGESHGGPGAERPLMSLRGPGGPPAAEWPAQAEEAGRASFSTGKPSAQGERGPGTRWSQKNRHTWGGAGLHATGRGGPSRPVWTRPSQPWAGSCWGRWLCRLGAVVLGIAAGHPGDPGGGWGRLAAL